MDARSIRRIHITEDSMRPFVVYEGVNQIERVKEYGRRSDAERVFEATVAR